jgi:hypothetical protein
VYRLCAYVLLKDFFNLKLTKLLISSFVLVIRKIGICMYIIRKIFDSNFNISSDIEEITESVILSVIPEKKLVNTS